jgi:hypothetical protein
MTSTTAPWDASLHPREATGKFDTKNQSAPELALDAADEFDLSSFMQEPPTAPEPFTLLQPVIYRNVDGEDEHAIITSISDDGFLVLTHRTPGTLNDTDDDEFAVDSRYVREDFDISRDAIRRQARGLSAALAVADEITHASQTERDGIDSYLDALAVRDELAVDGRTDWLASFRAAESNAQTALHDLSSRDLIAAEVESWAYLEGYGPREFDQLTEAVDVDGVVVARGATQAAVLEEFGEWSMADEDDLTLLKTSLADARDLGARLAESRDAASEVDNSIDDLGEDAPTVLAAAVNGLSQRKATSYRKALIAMNTAFSKLETRRLIGYENNVWSPNALGASVEDGAVLGRAAGQAAILRHFQPETGLTDAQFAAVASVFDGAVKAHLKRTAA